ncbi:MAG: glycosyltransferase [Pseudomonadota bacterium]
MRTAFIHYWLTKMRGGERVLETLSEMLPDADIFTHVLDRKNISSQLLSHNIDTTFIDKLPFARTHYQKYLPLMPRALEELDLQDFDLVISSESGPAKGVIPRPDALHVCYCHTPMRYIWDHYNPYLRNAGFATRIAFPHIAHKLRMLDVSSAARVDVFAANSNHVAKRLEKYYRRDSVVVHPPVDVDAFSPVESHEVEDAYLAAGELVAYKRFDIAVEAFTKSGRKLVVIGDGEERKTLEKMAGPNIEFRGRVPFEELKSAFAKHRALVFPGEEDFGIVPVEVMASGRPVIAYGRGGALDTVNEETSGVFFDEATADSLNNAIERFEREFEPAFKPLKAIQHARQFSPEVFKSAFRDLLAAHGVRIRPAELLPMAELRSSLLNDIRQKALRRPPPVHEPQTDIPHLNTTTLKSLPHRKQRVAAAQEFAPNSIKRN